MTDSPHQLLSPLHVAHFLSVSRKRVYQLIEQGQLPAVRLGPRQLRVRRAAVDAFVASREYDPGEALALDETES